MINEKLVLQTVKEMALTNASLTTVIAGFAAVLSTRLPTLTDEERQMLSEQSDSLMVLAGTQREAAATLQTALQAYQQSKPQGGN